MRLELFNYVEGDDSAQIGEYKGKISLLEDDIQMEVRDDELAEELEQLFSEPLLDANGISSDETETEPYTREFFRAVLRVLPDYGVRGVLRDDDEERGYFTSKVEEEEEEEEEEEVDEESEDLPMGMMSIEDLDEGYDDDSDMDDDEY